RLDALQAAILQVKLRYLDTWNAQRWQAAQRYQQLLSGIAGLILPQALPDAQSAWNQYTIRLSQPIQALRQQESNYRDQVQRQLQQQGISSTVYYPLPLHLQPVYQFLGYQPGQLPVAERLAQEVLSLPIFPELYPEEQAQVAHSLKDCLVQPEL
ncbi:MAG TPA: DegT/DnrJ/EryC1/StrS family aminotransferase, partial [Candidatus Caenarcaniphilales bacterium]